MIKNTLWFTFGMLLTGAPLVAMKHLTGQPPPFPFAWYAVWGVGFAVLLLAIRVMDHLLKDPFARRPAAERFATGLLMGCYIFAGSFLHS